MSMVGGGGLRGEWNLNAVAHMVGFAAMLITCGTLYAQLQYADQAASAEFERINRRLDAVEIEARRIEKHDLRLSSVEKQAANSAEVLESVKETLSSLSSDIRVVREILQRIESQGKQ